MLMEQVGLDVFMHVNPEIQKKVSGSETSSRFFPAANIDDDFNIEENFREPLDLDLIEANASKPIYLPNGNIQCKHSW